MIPQDPRNAAYLQIFPFVTTIGGQGSIRYDPSTDDLVLSSTTIAVPDPLKITRISGAQAFFTNFEETILLCGTNSEGDGVYRHPESDLSVSSWGAGYVLDMVNLQLEVPAADLLAFIRAHAITRSVVTNVPRPKNPVLIGAPILFRDGALVFDSGGQGRSEDERIYPVDAKLILNAYASGSFPLDLGNGLSLYQSENSQTQEKGYSLCLRGADSSIKIRGEAMFDFFHQLMRLSEWEEEHPPDSE